MLPSLSFLIRVCSRDCVPVTPDDAHTGGEGVGSERTRARARGVVGRMLRASTTCPKSRTITMLIHRLSSIYTMTIHDSYSLPIPPSPASLPSFFLHLFPFHPAVSLSPAPSWHALIPYPPIVPPVYRLLFFFPCPSPAPIYYLSPIPLLYSLSLCLTLYVHSVLVPVSFTLFSLVSVCFFFPLHVYLFLLPFFLLDLSSSSVSSFIS